MEKRLYMFAKIAKSIAAMNRVATAVADTGLMVMTGLVVSDVVLRRAFNAPIIFADEVAGYLLVLVTLMGLGYTLKEDGHIQVMILVQNISPRKRSFLRILWCLTSLVYTAILLFTTAELTWESYAMGAFSPTPSQLPIFPFQMLMPIGCLFLLLTLVIELVASIYTFIMPAKSTA
jgi:TRAP-type C4-dicarboxylate transport system permease small subunit